MAAVGAAMSPNDTIVQVAGAHPLHTLGWVEAQSQVAEVEETRRAYEILIGCADGLVRVLRRGGHCGGVGTV